MNRAHLSDLPGALPFAMRGVETAAGSVLRSLEVTALLTRCDAYERAGDYDRAMRDSTEALRVVGDLDLPLLRMRAQYLHANVLVGTDRFEEAIVDLERILGDPAFARTLRMRLLAMNLATVSYSFVGRATEAHAWFHQLRQVTGGAGDWAVWSAPYYASVLGETTTTVMLAAAQRTLYPFIGVSDHRRLSELTQRASTDLSPAARDQLIAQGHGMRFEDVAALADELLARGAA